MTHADRKVLFLTVAGDDKGFGQNLTSCLENARQYETMTLEAANYDAILDRLENPQVLPVVLKDSA